MTSRFDVVIPCYNYGRYLRDCAESVLSQRDANVRVLILDDCSRDDTPVVAAELAARDSRVTFRRHEVNQGHIATYNEGFLWASGEYVMLLSADDLLAPGAFSRTAKVMDSHPNVGLVYGDQILFAEEPPAVETPSDGRFDFRLMSSRDFLHTSCGTGDNVVMTATVVMRTSVLHSIGGFDRALPHTADLEMWLRIAARSNVAFVRWVQAFKRRHAANMQHLYLGHALGDIRERLAAFESFLTKDETRVKDAPALLQQARQALARAAFWSGALAFDRGDSNACRQCLEFASSVDPALPLSREWARMRWKRRMGHRAWQVLRPLVERVREQITVLSAS